MTSSNFLPELSTDTVVTLCFLAGMLLLAVGTVIGLVVSFRSDDGTKKVQEAKQTLESAREQAKTAADEVRGAGALEGPVDTRGVAAAADSAAAAASTAKTALDQVQGVIGALPERLRFAGLLIMVGTVLIGVATVQYGGTSLF
jgi:hypothetical protein